jgi:hypothetical protein
MGFLSTLFGGSKSKGPEVVREGFGNLFQDTGDRARDLSSQILGLADVRAGQTLDPFVIPESTPSFSFDNLLSSSRFGQPLLNELSDPSFRPQGVAEEALIADLLEQTGGRLGVRELDPTKLDIINTIAQPLVNLRQQRIQNLQQPFSEEIASTLAGLQQRETGRATDITGGLTGRQQDIDFGSDRFAQAVNAILGQQQLDRFDTTVAGGSSSSEGGIVPGIGSFFAINPGGSDRRLKENIVKVGRLVNGLFVYAFNYIGVFRDIWGGQRRLGVMADEVKLVLPHAVSVGPHGYDLVDYSEVLNGSY